MGVAYDEYVSVYASGHIDQPLDFPGLFAASPVSVRDMNGITDLPVMVLSVLQFAKTHKKQSGG
jgi:hypothetical protein